jgi:hypothetical protein
MTMAASVPLLPEARGTQRILNFSSELGTLFRPPLALNPTTPISWTPQSLTAGSAPFMYSSMVPTPGPLIISSPTANLGSGTIWLPAQQFAAAAPATRYFGLQIDSGVLQHSNSFLPDPPSAHLFLNLTQVSSESGPLDVMVSPPSTVEFFFTTTTSSLTAAGTGNATIFGTAIKFDFLETLPDYRSDFSRIEFPF